MKRRPEADGAASPEIEVKVTPADVEEQLSRICSHHLFASAPAMRKFLQFAVRRTMEGLSHEIKEYTIGMELLGRGVSFDTRDTSIVRTQAFNLRSRLKAYYAEHGEEVPFQIRFRPGSYIPLFVTVPAVAAAAAPAEASGQQGVIRLTVKAELAGSWGDEQRSQMEDLHRSLTVKLLSAGTFRVAYLAADQAQAEVPESDFRVESRVERIGQDQIQVQLQVADQRDRGFLVWARSFAWPTANLEVQRAAAQIAEQLEQALRKLTNQPSPAAASQSPEAQATLAEGHSYLGRMNVAACHRAQRMFQHAMKSAPKSGAAHSGFALAVIQGVLLQDSVSLGQSVDAEVAAARSLALDYGAQQSQLARGAALALFEWETKRASDYLMRAEALAAGQAPDPLTRTIVALLDRFPRNRVSEAIDMLQPVVEMFPLNMFARFALGTALRCAHRDAEAVTIFSAALELDDRCGVAAMGIAQVFAGKADGTAQALRMLQTAESLTGRTPAIIGLESYIVGMAGQHERAAVLEEELIGRAKPEANFFFERALARLGRGQHEEALYALEQSIHLREASAFVGQLDPLLERLRESPLGRQVFTAA